MNHRPLAFARWALRATRDPAWRLVVVLRGDGQPPHDLLARCRISDAEWARWAPVVHAPTLQTGECPHWVALALAAHKVRSPADARSAWHGLALPHASLPLLVLATHSLAFHSLVSLLPALPSPLPRHVHAPFYFNALLQAIALFDRSRVAADVALDVLAQMDTAALPLWPDTERVLIRDNFRSPQLLDHLRRRGHHPPHETWMRAYASLGRVQQSAHYLHAIRNHCLENGLAPPYTEHDDRGSAHRANTHHLRAMRDDRPAAFRYLHHLLKCDLERPSHPDTSEKSNIDIYDWTTALYAAAHDRTLSASAFLDLFNATRQGTNAYQPTRATYTVVIQGLLWKNALDDAQNLWDEFLGKVVSVRGTSEENEMRIDRKALCVGVDVLVQSRRTEEALCLLEEAVKRDREQTKSPYLKVHPIHALLTALLRIRRPDAIFYIWTHLTSLYYVPPTNLMLRVLLKAAMQASKMDGESLKGAMRWYMADKSLLVPAPAEIADKPSRDTIVAGLHDLLRTPTPPSVVGIWANRRSTQAARSIFRGMIFGNWPTLRHDAGGGVTPARAKGGDSVFQEFARVLAGRPDRFLPAHPTIAGPAPPPDADEQLGPAIPTIIPSESTFASYVCLLGLSSRAEEIPEVLVWMRALGVMPKTETLAVALVFWMEVGLRGPMFEDGTRTEYGALRAWIQEWVGEKKAPGEEDVYVGIKRVREMREGRTVPVS